MPRSTSDVSRPPAAAIQRFPTPEPQSCCFPKGGVARFCWKPKGPSGTAGGGSAMRTLRRFLLRLAGPARKRRDEERLEEELEQHLALQTAANLRAGLSPAEARRQAVLK